MSDRDDATQTQSTAQTVTLIPAGWDIVLRWKAIVDSLRLSPDAHDDAVERAVRQQIKRDSP